jgi:exodeoxyribonuclease III
VKSIVRLISWNVAGKVRAIADQLEALGQRQPDIVALQEVRMRGVPAFRAGLATIGLDHAVENVQLAARHRRRYGLLLASRWPLTELPATAVPQPERVLSAMVHSPWGSIELHTAHIPPGAAYGWIRIATLEGIFQRLALASACPRILCGDFNAPQAERHDGQIVTWAQDTRHDDELVLWETWRDVDGQEYDGERWDRAERNVLSGLAAYNLPDAYRQLYLRDGQDYRPDFSWCGRGSTRRYDHIFASSRLRAASCTYLHGFREAGLSDHAPVEAVFQLV